MLTRAEAILKLRALIGNGGFSTYWRFYLTREHQRIHPPPSRTDTISRPDHQSHCRRATPIAYDHWRKELLV